MQTLFGTQKFGVAMFGVGRFGLEDAVPSNALTTDDGDVLITDGGDSITIG